MKVLILGASGFIGQHLMQALCANGHKVVALGREVAPVLAPQARITWVAAPLQDTDLEGVVCVINCLGAFRVGCDADYDAIHYAVPLAIFQQSVRVGIRKIIQLSALGVDTPVAKHSRFLSSKKLLDDAVQTMAVDWTVIRPSIVFGPGERSMAFFKALALFPWVLLVRQGQTRVQPVYIHDLIALIVCAVEQTHAQHQVLAAVGPESLSWAEMMTLHRRWLGQKAPKVINLPTWGVTFFGWCGERLRSPFVSRQGLRITQVDNTADAQAMTQMVGHELTRLAEYLTEYPRQRVDLWRCWQVWLTPTLRIMLALMWVVTGWVSWFVYPHAQSYTLLTQVGVPVDLAPFTLLFASLLDGFLGLALLLRYHLTLVIVIQLALMGGYTFIISWGLLEYWAHPFGPILKNLPIIAATALLWVLEQQEK